MVLDSVNFVNFAAARPGLRWDVPCAICWAVSGKRLKTLHIRRRV
jgi:hypothetical protein